MSTWQKHIRSPSPILTANSACQSLLQASIYLQLANHCLIQIFFQSLVRPGCSAKFSSNYLHYQVCQRLRSRQNLILYKTTSRRIFDMFLQWIIIFQPFIQSNATLVTSDQIIFAFKIKSTLSKSFWTLKTRPSISKGFDSIALLTILLAICQCI